jgi:hypothetical protein
MRFGTSLFAALVLAGTLANAARGEPPGASGPYSVYLPGLTYRQDSSYTGPYSVYGPRQSYRQDSSYRGPYYDRFSSASSSDGKGRGLGDGVTRPDAGRAPAAGSGPGASRYRYVRISIAGNTIQGIVVP